VRQAYRGGLAVLSATSMGAALAGSTVVGIAVARAPA
jgi:hypothetical protein